MFSVLGFALLGLILCVFIKLENDHKREVEEHEAWKKDLETQNSEDLEQVVLQNQANFGNASNEDDLVTFHIPAHPGPLHYTLNGVPITKTDLSFDANENKPAKKKAKKSKTKAKKSKVKKKK